ncbi:Apolipoprotein N-acyltransferase [hydrothermal vent metagenome]|uniref:Apolipoprotein N-acyltransferase n=1 Tax=hydrothermal vent metagenome TaxID=652676 RepID=A0A1W1CJ55_9ZZZZ
MRVVIKISRYFTINKITMGFFIAFLSSASIYLDWIGFINPFINTIIGLLALYFWLISDKKSWVWSGFFVGILWFWWMGISFIHYQMSWAIPFIIIGVAFIYGSVFYLGISFVYFIEKHLKIHNLIGKALLLLLFSYIHPLGFDWFKPELMFTNSYIGIEKWQFALVIFSFNLAIYNKKILFLIPILGAYPYASYFQKVSPINNNIKLVNTFTPVEKKWIPKFKQQHIDEVFMEIQNAIQKQKEIVVFPESVFALYLNKEKNLIKALKNYSNYITIVTGGLYYDNNLSKNSTYIFDKGEYRVADKVVLVPFGEQNPLPSWMGKWINKIFFDGAPDYVPAKDFTDYNINGTKYRNAICFEATSEKLYQGKPKNMIILSNNGWLVPSIEPTQQKILLQYYSKKYGTTIYHSINMSKSYIVHNGEVSYE